MELEEGDISNGSDTEVEEDLGYMLGEENALEEVRHQRVLGELDNIVRNICVSDIKSNHEFVGFQNMWMTITGAFIPQNAQNCQHNRGLAVNVQWQLLQDPKAMDGGGGGLDDCDFTAAVPKWSLANPGEMLACTHTFWQGNGQEQIQYYLVLPPPSCQHQAQPK